VSIADETIVVGAIWEDSNAVEVDGDQDNDDGSTNDSGAAYVFVRSGTDWSQQAYLKASNPAAGSYFGWSVSISGNVIVVGAIYDDTDGAESGAAYVFEEIWSPVDFPTHSESQ
jgi:hypothetical protein